MISYLPLLRTRRGDKPQMNLEVVRDYDTMSRRGADVVSGWIMRKPDCVMGLAAGSTPMGMYSKLVDLHVKGKLDFSRVTTFNLDEFVRGASRIPVYEMLIWQEFLGHTNIDRDKVHFPGSASASIDDAGADYENLLRNAGGIDLQILGVGTNGHLAFNEPGSSRSSRTRKESLTAESARANARKFGSDEDVPGEAITMGIATILRASSLLLLASGQSKAVAVRAMLEGPVTRRVPASYVRTHPDTHVILDDAAASLLHCGTIRHLGSAQSRESTVP